MKRPEQVPADARWNESDGEWETGTIEDGVRQGDFTWWRPDGTRVGRSTFDEAGRLHGICRRYHPDGQISLESRYVHDVRWGKTWHTRSLSGDSPEDVHLATVPPSTFRLEMIYVAGQTAPLTTRLNREGAAAPPETRGGMLVDWRTDIRKVERGTAFSLLGTMHDVAGNAFDGRALFFDGIADSDPASPAPHLRFTVEPPTDASSRGLTMGARKTECIVSIDEAARFLVLVVDGLDARIVDDRPPTPLGMKLDVRDDGVFVGALESEEALAARGGVCTGDRIARLNGQPIATALDYVSMTRSVAEAGRCELLLERGAEQLTVTIDLAGPPPRAASSKRQYTWYGHASSEGGPILLTDAASFAAWRGADESWGENAVYRVHYYGPLVEALDESLRPSGDDHHQEALVHGIAAARAYLERLAAEAARIEPALAAREQATMTLDEIREKARGDVSAWLPAWRDHLEHGTDFVVGDEVVLHVEIGPDTDYARACALETEEGDELDAIVVPFGPDGAHRALSWELQGAGTADVAVASDGRGLLLLRTWLDDEGNERDAQNFASDADPSAETSVGEISFPEGLVAIVWAPVGAGDLGPTDDMAAALRAAAKLNPPVQLNQEGMLGVGTLARIEPGTYRASCGEHREEAGVKGEGEDDDESASEPWSCRWLRLERTGD